MENSYIDNYEKKHKKDSKNKNLDKFYKSNEDNREV